MLQAAPHEILVRRHADNFREQAQEVERAQAGLMRRVVEIDRLLRMRICINRVSADGGKSWEVRREFVLKRRGG